MQNNRFTVGSGTTDVDFILEYLRKELNQDYDGIAGRGITVNAGGIGGGKVSFIAAYFWDIGQDSISYKIHPQGVMERVLKSVESWQGFSTSSSITREMLDKKQIKQQFKIARLPKTTPKNKTVVLGVHPQADLLKEHDLHVIQIIGEPRKLKQDIKKNAPVEYARIQHIIDQREAASASPQRLTGLEKRAAKKPLQSPSARTRPANAGPQ